MAPVSTTAISDAPSTVASATRSSIPLPEMFMSHNAGNLLQTFEVVQIRRQLLYAALTHFFIGLITILLTILLGSTVTEAILAVWALFCGVVGFGAICVHRAHISTSYQDSSDTVSFARIWLQVYLGMTGLGAFLAAATVIHGAVLLGMSVPVQAGRQRTSPDLQEFITSSFSVWFVILGASNVFIGLAAGAADMLLIKKTLITLRNHKAIIGRVGERSTADQPPRYGDVPPPRYSAENDGSMESSGVVSGEGKGRLPQEAPPSYEAALTAGPQPSVSSGITAADQPKTT